MDTQLLISLAIIHSVALLSPGPDFALVVKLASQQTRVTAIAGAAGISIAILAHCLMGLTGISLLIQNSSTAFLITQLVGASYLGWIGYSAIKSALASRGQTATVGDGYSAVKHSTSKGFRMGLWTNLLNPKALVFFITLFSTLLTPDTALMTKVSAAFVLFFLSLIWFVFIAVVLSKPAIKQRFQRMSGLIDLISGLVFVGVALVIVAGVF